jgi:4-amino-4-deoxy-L-arabinose transferase-like glycosyltransferase
MARKSRPTPTVPHSSHGDHWPNHGTYLRILLAITLFALALRVGYVLEIRHQPHFSAPETDAAWYDNQARQFAEGRLGEVPFFRVPLYPLVLSACYRLFGGGYLMPRLFQALLSALTILLLADLARRLAGRRAAQLAAALLACHGLSIYFSGELLLTTLVIALDLGFLLAFLAAEDGRPRLHLLSGLLLGLSVITRPSVLLAAPLGFIWILYGHRRRLKQSAAPAALFFLGVVLPILPVTLTNLVAGGEAVLLATQGGVNFYIGNNAEATGAHATLPGAGPAWQREDARALAEAEAGRRLTAAEESSFYFGKGLDFVRSSPGSWLALMVKKTAIFWNRVEIGSNRDYGFAARESLVLRCTLPLGFALIGPLGLAGMIALLFRRDKTRAPLLFLTLFNLLYMAGVVIFFVNARFRMPVVPLLILFASIFILSCPGQVRRPGFPRLGATLLAVAALVSWWPLGVAAGNPAFGHFHNGNALLEQGDLPGARAAFTLALEQSPGYPQAHLNIGFTHFREGNLDRAADAFHQELRLHPESEKAMYNLGVVSRDAGDIAGAEEWLRRALEVKPYFVEARTTLAALLFQKGTAEANREQVTRALSLFGEAVQLDGSRPVYRYNYALALGQSGRESEALEQLRAALEIDPGFEPARQMLKAAER